MFRTALLTTLLTATSAFAQDVPDRNAARDMLFGTRNADIAIIRQDFLSEADLATLQQLPQVAQLKYYGAMAAAPAEGLQSETTQGAFNFHSLEAARAAAIAACNDARSGGPTCVTIAEIRPRNFEPGRSLTLSQDASRAVTGRDLRSAGPDGRLAISAATGFWAVGDGAEAALAACSAQGASDCEIAVAR